MATSIKGDPAQQLPTIENLSFSYDPFLFSLEKKEMGRPQRKKSVWRKFRMLGWYGVVLGNVAMLYRPILDRILRLYPAARLLELALRLDPAVTASHPACCAVLRWNYGRLHGAEKGTAQKSRPCFSLSRLDLFCEPNDLVGSAVQQATYLFKSKHGDVFVFLQPVQCPAVKSSLNQGILRYALAFHCLPERTVINHLHHHPTIIGFHYMADFRK